MDFQNIETEHEHDRVVPHSVEISCTFCSNKRHEKSVDLGARPSPTDFLRPTRGNESLKQQESMLLSVFLISVGLDCVYSDKQRWQRHETSTSWWRHDLRFLV
jgi:hypothetical protein